MPRSPIMLALFSKSAVINRSEPWLNVASNTMSPRPKIANWRPLKSGFSSTNRSKKETAVEGMGQHHPYFGWCIQSLRLILPRNHRRAFLRCPFLLRIGVRFSWCTFLSFKAQRALSHMQLHIFKIARLIVDANPWRRNP